MNSDRLTIIIPGLLFELSKSPKDQQRVYAEIQDVRARIGVDTQLTSSDYDSMPFFNAVIKVSSLF